MIRPECILSGDNFNPLNIINILPNIKIEKMIGAGEIATIGRYKGKPCAYGLCKISTPDNVAPEERIKWMTTLISNHLGIFRENGVTDIELSILWKGYQGSIEFTHDELKAIADLGIPLTIDYLFQND